MLIAYVDESYSKDYYYIAAYVIEDTEQGRVIDAFKEASDYAAGFGVSEGVEFHAHRLMTGTDGWEPVRGKARAAISIYRRALQCTVKAGGRMFIRGVDVRRLNARYKYPHPPHRVVLQHLLEALNDYAVQQETTIRVIADHIDGEQAHHDQMERYRTSGTPGYRSSRLAAVDVPIMFEDSALHPGLQAADMIAYLYRRRDAHETADPRARKAVDELWAILKPAWEIVWRWDPRRTKSPTL